MEQSVLLVLLSLQVVLLITAFTSADAAALETDPQRPPGLVVRRNDRDREVFGNRRKRYANCSWRPGGCGFAVGFSPTFPENDNLPTPPPPPPPTRPTLSREVLFKRMHGRDEQRATFGEEISDYY